MSRNHAAMERCLVLVKKGIFYILEGEISHCVALG